jgi:hypothetical protein
MSRLAKCQLIGPVILFAAVLAAEIATYALAQVPSSEMLWSYTGISHFELVFIALPTFILSCIELVTRHRILVAMSSNLSFVYAVFLGYWMVPDFYFVEVLIGASLLSFCISHFIYIRSASVAY